MRNDIISYSAVLDSTGAFIPLRNRRRYIVIKYRDGKFAYVCGAFGTLEAARKRAAELNANRQVA